MVGSREAKERAPWDSVAGNDIMGACMMSRRSEKLQVWYCWHSVADPANVVGVLEQVSMYEPSATMACE